jgi:hypothetical protein
MKTTDQDVLMSDSLDILESLKDMAYIIDQFQGKAVVTMLSGSIFNEAADEIEKLQKEINDLRLQIVTLSIPKESNRD